MKLEFIGATHEVTGSCTYMTAAGKNILIDFGMEQGEDEFENQDVPVFAGMVDYVFLTHAHVDHSGLLPLLYKQGFRGKVFCTTATQNLCGIMLLDCAHIQEFEAEWKARKAKRSGDMPPEPLFDTEDAQGVLELFEGCVYNTDVAVCEGISIRFYDAGHLLGSSSIAITVTEAGKSVKTVFSGDIGNIDQPLIRDPQCPGDADYVVMESTYGGRVHDTPPDYAVELAEVFKRVYKRGGNIVIPSFAVGRTQELLYFIREIKNRGLAPELGNFTVYVDSPLAIRATHIFNEVEKGYYDREAEDLIRSGINPISFDGLKIAVTSDESKLINFSKEFSVIISASGMCEAGRVRHHLKHNLWRPESAIVFVGYQAGGTLGRMLLDGVKKVKLFGEEVAVAAEIINLPGISGHADQPGLERWISGFTKKPMRVFAIHGNDEACNIMQARLREMGYNADAPYSGTVFDLATGSYLTVTDRVTIKKKVTSGSRIFDRLLACGQRLLAIITKKRGASNKELKKFADEVDSLCDKWEK